MRLLVAHPDSRRPERAYALHVVLGEMLGLDFEAQPSPRTDTCITMATDEGGCVHVAEGLLGIDDADWLRPSSLPSDTPRRTASGLPVLFGEAAGSDPIKAEGERRVHVDLDVFGVALFMLSRYEELLCADRDRHDRFAAASSVAARGGWLHRPIVNEYVEVLWSALASVWPGLRPKALRYRVQVSHDVDWPTVAIGEPWPRVAVHAAADVIRRADAATAARRLHARLTGSIAAPHRDPAWTFDTLMDAAESRNLAAEFYFITDHAAGRLDGTYDLGRAPMPTLLRTIHQRGHAIGLHGSYTSYDNPDQLRNEFERLRRACAEHGVEQATWGGRQHFLRWANPQTWRAWEAAGLGYDATLGYADRLGFRCGICHAYPVFDLEQRRMLKLYERPLIAMDVTALNYMKLSAERAIEQIAALAATCRRFGGTMTLLWHNTMLMTPRHRALYERILDAVC